MEYELWSKTLLKSYGFMEKITKAIDRTFNKIAFTSRSTCTNDTLLSTTYHITEKLLCLLERKVLLINARVMIDEILANLDKSSSKILVLKFMNNLTGEELTQVTNASIRTVMRKTNKALKEFGEELKNRGLTIDDLELMFKSERWIINIFTKAKEENRMYMRRTEDYSR